MVKNPFQFKKSSTQRGHVWLEIATNLACIKELKFKTDLDQSAIRDRYNLLSSKLRKKLSSEKKASGIDTEMSEVEDMIEELIQIEDDSTEKQRLNDEERKKKADTDKENANDIRVQATEKLGETKRRKENEGQEQKITKRKRSNGSEPLQY
jgi:DNA replication protein DnaD